MKFFPAHAVSDIRHPPLGRIKGRAAMIRIKDGSDIDITIACMYPPPATTPAAEAISADVMQWIEAQLQAPLRKTTPIVCTDANCKLGDNTDDDQDGLFIASPAVGEEQPVKGDDRSRNLKYFLERGGLSAANTFYERPHEGATYF